MSYLTQLQAIGNAKTLTRKKEYISYNFGKDIDHRLKKKMSSVLEIGPGFGDFVEYVAEKKVKNIDIVDNDKSLTQFIQKKYKTRHVFLTNKLQSLKRKLDHYDVIMMTQVLEHIPKKAHVSVIRTLVGHLKKNGLLIITVPNIGNPLAIFERYYDYTHELAFTEHSLEQMIDFCGLKHIQIRVQPFNIPPYSLVNIIRIVLQKTLHVLFKLFYIVNGGVYPHILTTNITLLIEKIA